MLYIDTQQQKERLRIQTAEEEDRLRVSMMHRQCVLPLLDAVPHADSDGGAGLKGKAYVPFCTSAKALGPCDPWTMEYAIPATCSNYH